MNAETKQEPNVAELKEIVDRHTLCYEVYPIKALTQENIVQVGFTLELYGTHDHGHTRLTPGCDVCRRTFQDLKKVAEWILPKEKRESWYEILPFDSALHESRRRRMQPEVLLAIEIKHRLKPNEPIDACEERCLRDMETKLAQLGVRAYT